jgi:molybdopterin-guanine dinucleotide biosynthesis protein A
MVGENGRMREPARCGVVLAGGAGARLGGGKPAIELAGRPLIAYPLQAIERAGLEAVTVAKPGTLLPGICASVIREPQEPQHPLTGIVAALEELDAPIVVLGCDMPFVPADLIRDLAARPGNVVTQVHGELEPLLARYDPASLPALRSGLADASPLRAVVEELNPEILTESDLSPYGSPPVITRSINEPHDLAAADAALTPPARP